MNAYDALCDITDAFVVDDDMPQLLNTHGFERIARWGFSECREKEHWKGEKAKLRTRWELLSRYHVTEKAIADAYSEDAEGEVTAEMSKEALYKKYLSKLEIGTEACV